MSDINEKSKVRRRIVVGIVAGGLAIAGGMFIFQPGQQPSRAPTPEIEGAIESLTDLSSQPRAEDSAYQIYERRLQRLEENSLRLEETNQQLEQRVQDLTSERDQTVEEAALLVEQLADEVERLSQEQQSPGEPAPSPAGASGWPASSVGAGQPYSVSRDPFVTAGPVGASSAPEVTVSGELQTPQRVLRSFNFQTGSEDASAEPDQPVIRDTETYVPPNSYVSARVLVGVDAATGVDVGSDPKPVLLRVTGPARSAFEEDRVLETDLIGCLINGAAYAELSSEKVYVRIQRMTCPLNDGTGRISETEVQGYVAHAGKAGVRGRVISREGDLTNRALIAGALEGVGQTFSQMRPGGGLMGGGISLSSGDFETPTAGELASASLSSGLGEAAGTLADYYVDRLEQYQPVIEMPTGIDVEIVFIRGAQIR